MSTPTAPTITLGGNATVLIRHGDTGILTDPWLTDRIGPWRRLRPCGLSASDLPALSAILISHAHLDHLAPRSLALLPIRTPVVTPHGPPLQKLQALGFSATHPLHEWEEWESDLFRVMAVPSVHTRWCLGYTVEIAGRRIYFAGDSGPLTPFGEIAARCGPLDAALIPVGGSSLAVGPLQRHLTPDLAARAAAILQPRMAIPMHWGHMPCVPAAIDRFRGTAEQFVRSMERHAPGVTVLWPDGGVPVELA